MSKEAEVYVDDLEKKRKEISKFAYEQYKKDGKLSGKALLRETNALDGVMNKRQLEERLSKYNSNHIPE